MDGVEEAAEDPNVDMGRAHLCHGLGPMGGPPNPLVPALGSRAPSSPGEKGDKHCAVPHTETRLHHLSASAPCLCRKGKTWSQQQSPCDQGQMSPSHVSRTPRPWGWGQVLCMT